MNCQRLFCWIFPAFLMAIVPAPANARDKRKAAFEKLYRGAQKDMSDVEYKKAIKKLQAASQLLNELSDKVKKDTQVSVCEMLGTALTGLETPKNEQAISAFEQCLRIRPTYRADCNNPHVCKNFNKALRRYLTKKLTLEPRLPKPPALHPFPVPKAEHLRLHVPTELLRSGMIQTADSPHEVEVQLGTMVLFGEDAATYQPGFGAGLIYRYAVGQNFQVLGGAYYFQHEYAGDDLKAGASGTLLVLNPGVGVRAHFLIAGRIDLGAAVMGGVSLMGIGSLSERVGGFFSTEVAANVLISSHFSLGVSVIPTITLGTGRDGEAAQSFSLPIMTRLQASF
jgi:hypothetical protein